MRVLYLNPAGILGGGERSLLDLIVAVKRSDPSIEQRVLLCDNGPLAAASSMLGIETQIVQMPDQLLALGEGSLHDFRAARTVLRAGGLFVRYARTLALAIRAFRPDLVHSNGMKSNLLTRFAVAEAPVIWHVRDFIGARPIARNLVRGVARRSTCIIANSCAVAEDAKKSLGWKRQLVPVHVVYNGIDTERFAPGPGDGSELDRLAHMPPAQPGTLRVGLVATYARWKGHDVFLQAARRLRDRHPAVNARFYIIGGPVYRTPGSQFTEVELREMATELGVNDIFGMIPFQDEPADVYRALDVVVHASTQPEPFGRTIVEAMACGRPVIVSSAGGARELFTDGLDAIGVAPADAEALQAAIVRLVGAPDLCNQLGRAARETAVTRFSRDRVGVEIVGLYRRLTAASGKMENP